jgi:hypothetical protein
MPLHLRRSAVRNAILTMIVCLAISLGLSYFFGGGPGVGVGQLAWPLILALGIGVYSWFAAMRKIKRGILSSLLANLSYTPIDRADYPDFDWQSVDDYAIQLETRGFQRLGNYTLYPAFSRATGIVTCFIDKAETTLVEVQMMRIHGATAEAMRLPSDAGGIHFSVSSVLAGRIPVTTTDTVPSAADYLIRGDYDVMASHQGMSLPALLEKHAQLVTYMQSRTGKRLSKRLNLSRHIILARERFAQAKRRTERRSGYRMASLFDAFEAAPKKSWSTSSAQLARTESRAMEAIDLSGAARGRAPVMETQQKEADDGPQVPAELAMAQQVELETLRSRMESGANWFYWIAALSAVNAVVALMGSNWGFAIGLGISQVMTAIATELQKDVTASNVVTITLWVLSFAAIAFIAGCGNFARRPSTVAFVVGIAIFGLDTLIFLLAGDWIGVIFHFIALFFLWSGMSAGRELKKMAAE